jgi:hypothetical protein
VQGVEGHRDTGQVQRREQRLEVPGFIRLRTDLHLGERRDAAVGDRRKQVTAGCVSAGGALERLAVHGDDAP